MVELSTILNLDNVEVSKHKSLTNMFYNFVYSLNGLIGAETDVNYHIPQPTNNPHLRKRPNLTLKFNIDMNTINANDYHSVYSQKIETIKNYIENHDWTKDQVKTQRIIRTIAPYISSTLSFPDDIVSNEKININYDFSKLIKSTQIKIKKSKNIVEIVDPLIEDYTITIDISKDLSIFDYGYNYLHLYEHLKTNCWRNLDKRDLKLINGFTSVDGTCYVYVVLSSKEAFETYLKAINNFKLDTLELEINRTLSETIQDKSLTLFGRTNTDGYKRNVIRMLDQDGYKLITITPHKVKINDFVEVTTTDKAENKTADPKPIYSNYIPLSVLKDKEHRPYHFFGNELVGIDMDKCLLVRVLEDKNKDPNIGLEMKMTPSGVNWL